jgi:NADH:ubiquinone oxidoreductase subunit 2 (subunit N)
VTSELMRFPLVGFGPQLALAAGVLALLASGLACGFPARVCRALTPLVLLAALALAALTLPGASHGPLIHVDGLALGWQYVFYIGALPFALLMRADDEVSPALLLGSVLGMALLASSANLLMLFIGLEFLSLPAYLLVARAKGRGPGAPEAAV